MKFRNFIERASLVGTLGIIVLGGLTIGAAVFYGANLGGASVASRVATAPITPAVTPPVGEQVSAITSPTAINWQPSFEAALAQSRASGKPVMVDFKAKWCGPCRMMDEQTYPDAAVIAASQKFVMVQVDVDEHEDIAGRYRVASLPTMMWMHADGKPFAQIQGGLPPEMLLDAMSQANKRA